MLKIYNHYQGLKNDSSLEENNKVSQMEQKRREINIQTTLKELMRRSDMIDEIYGKSITFDRFLTAFMVA